jgi:putative FmdB family regulatory protein
MPIYEFQCPTCDVAFEALMPIGTAANVCPQCSGTATKVQSSFSARTISKSKKLTKQDARKKKHDIKLPDDVKRPNFDLGPPPPLPDRYVHQLKHHGHC